MQFKFKPAEDEMTDSEYVLCRDDWSETDISIQDCRSYGGGYSVNRYGYDDPSDESTFWIMDLSNHTSLTSAKSAAIASFVN